MKKIVLSIVFLVLGSAIAAPVFAQDIGLNLMKSAANEAGFGEHTDEFTFAQTLGLIVQMVLSFVGIIFLSLMVYAGYLWMTARGAEDQVKKAQDIIRMAIIGLIITIGAYSITSFIVPKVSDQASFGEAPTGVPATEIAE